jgi:MFS family permease
VRSALASGRLRRIVVAYAINRLGTWMGLLALMVAVYDHTHSALAVSAMLFAGQALPAFVVPAVVARVEASKRRREISGLYFFEGVVTAALAGLLLWRFSLPLVVLLVALDGTAALAASALLRAEVSRAAREQHEAERPQAPAADGGAGAEAEAAEAAERSGNAALNLAFSTSFVLGPVLGGVTVAGLGVPATLLIDVGSFFICGSLLLDLHPHVEEAGGDSIRARLRAAWHHIKRVERLRGLLSAEGAALVLSTAASPIEVAYAKETLAAGDRGLGLLLTAWGAGAVLGSLLFARLRWSLAAIVSAGTLAMAAAFVGFAAAPSLAPACIVAVLGGAGNGLELPSFISLLQRLTPQNLHGRVMAAFESLGALSLAIGLPLGGALAALSAPRAALLVLGLATAVTAPLLLYLGRTARPSGAEARASAGVAPERSEPAANTGLRGAQAPR